MSDKRTLVCVIAETRAHKITWPSFKQNLLNELNADLALCISTPDGYDYENPFWQEAKYKWTVPEYDDWGQAFDLAQSQIMQRCGIEEKMDWRKLLLIKDQWLGGIEGENKHPGSAAILIYFRWHLLAGLIDDGIINKYDRFIITRSDFLWESPHPPLVLLDKSKIWVPDGEAYYGITDRHAVLSPEHLVPYLNLIELIVCWTDNLYKLMEGDSVWNLEQYIHFVLLNRGYGDSIKYFPYCMYSVREREGTTRWKKGTWSEELGYYIKYSSEYASALETKKALQGIGGWCGLLEGDSEFRFNAALQDGDGFFGDFRHAEETDKLHYKRLNSSEYLDAKAVLHVDYTKRESTLFLARPGLGNNERILLIDHLFVERVSKDTYFIKSASTGLYFSVNRDGLLITDVIPYEFKIYNRYIDGPRGRWVGPMYGGV